MLFLYVLLLEGAGLGLLPLIRPVFQVRLPTQAILYCSMLSLKPTIILSLMITEFKFQRQPIAIQSTLFHQQYPVSSLLETTIEKFWSFKNFNESTRVPKAKGKPLQLGALWSQHIPSPQGFQKTAYLQNHLHSLLNVWVSPYLPILV